MLEQTEKPIILIVDDTIDNLDLLGGVLGDQYKVKAALSGERALRIAQKSPHPDMILLDVMMPNMDGCEVCRRLKADPATADIPVIFITAKAMVEDEQKGLELGAVDYITKPISAPIVLARVKTQLALKQSLVKLQEAYAIIHSQNRRMKTELDIGREIQMNMIPDIFPDRYEFALHASLQAAREVGGDFYDFFFVDEGKICVCIGDVSGKGVPAALFMVMAKTLIKSRASTDFSTASIVTHVNDTLSEENDAHMFVTLFIAILDTRSGELIYTNAGHNPPYLLNSSGTLQTLSKRHGMVVGAMTGVTYGESKQRLSYGDLLFLFTDGITEALDSNGVLFSEQRLEKSLTGLNALPVKEIVKRVGEAVSSHEAGTEQSDDITALALRFVGCSEATSMEICITNDIKAINAVYDQFHAFSEKHAFSKKVRARVNMALDELLSNIILYAYQDELKHDIEVKVILSGCRLILTITDDGVPFNPFTVKTPDTNLTLDEKEVGGLGIHLVREMFDRVSYKRRIGQNVVTIEKHLNCSDYKKTS